MEKTNRGFDFKTFNDRYNQKCSIQKSSLATEDCIWLGVDNPNPLVLAKNAAKYGIETEETTGWISYPIPEDVLIHTHMHLSRKTVKELLPFLIKFAETGELE